MAPINKKIILLNSLLLIGLSCISAKIYSMQQPKEQAIEIGYVCPICFDDPDYKDEEIIALPCHKNHTGHWKCLKEFADKSTKNTFCPICRNSYIYQDVFALKPLTAKYAGYLSLAFLRGAGLASHWSFNGWCASAAIPSTITNFFGHHTMPTAYSLFNPRSNPLHWNSVCRISNIPTTKIDIPEYLQMPLGVLCLSLIQSFIPGQTLVKTLFNNGKYACYAFILKTLFTILEQIVLKNAFDKYKCTFDCKMFPLFQVIENNIQARQALVNATQSNVQALEKALLESDAQRWKVQAHTAKQFIPEIAIAAIGTYCGLKYIGPQLEKSIGCLLNQAQRLIINQ